MSIPIGTVVDAHNPVWIINPLDRGDEGESGPSYNADIFQRASDQSSQADELAGKIGPAIKPYNPEVQNRMVQEY